MHPNMLSCGIVSRAATFRAPCSRIVKRAVQISRLTIGHASFCLGRDSTMEFEHNIAVCRIRRQGLGRDLTTRIQSLTSKKGGKESEWPGTQKTIPWFTAPGIGFWSSPAEFKKLESSPVKHWFPILEFNFLKSRTAIQRSDSRLILISLNSRIWEFKVYKNLDVLQRQLVGDSRNSNVEKPPPPILIL